MLKNKKSNKLYFVFKLVLFLHAFPLLLFGFLLQLVNLGSEPEGGGFFDLVSLMTTKPNGWRRLGVIFLLEVMNVFLWYAFYDLIFLLGG